MLFAVFGCYSCRQVVEIDINYDGNKLVVNSFFNPDSVISLRLSHSEFILKAPRFEPVEGASAILLDENGEMLDEMSYAGNGLYKSTVKPQRGQAYQIKVEKEGYPVVTARDKVPADTARVIKVETKILDTNFDQLSLSFWVDDPEGNDYYEVYAFAKSKVYYEPPADSTITYYNRLYISSNEAIFHGFDYDNPGRVRGVILGFEDDLFEGTTTKITLRADLYRYRPCQAQKCKNEYTIILFLRKTSESYYRYKTSIKRQNESVDNPFSEPVPVYNNIKNGLGIFAGFNTGRYTTKLY